MTYILKLSRYECELLYDAAKSMLFIADENQEPYEAATWRDILVKIDMVMNSEKTKS